MDDAFFNRHFYRHLKAQLWIISQKYGELGSFVSVWRIFLLRFDLDDLEPFIDDEKGVW